MKYAVNIAREFGENTLKTLFINSYDDREEYARATLSLASALEKAGLEVDVNVIEREDEWTIAHIIFRGIDK